MELLLYLAALHSASSYFLEILIMASGFQKAQLLFIKIKIQIQPVKTGETNQIIVITFCKIKIILIWAS